MTPWPVSSLGTTNSRISAKSISGQEWEEWKMTTGVAEKWKTRKGDEEKEREQGTEATNKMRVKTENLLPPGVSMDHFKQFLLRQQQQQYRVRKER